MSPALRWWSPWWWPLVHLRSFRCRLLDGFHYTCTLHRVQTKTTQTPPKPLQTLASIGVSQPHDGDTKTADATATATPRDVTATAWPQPRHDGRPRRARRPGRNAVPRPRRGHDMHGHDRIQRNVPARYHTTRQNTIAQTFQRCTMQQTPPWGSLPRTQKARPLGLWFKS